MTSPARLLVTSVGSLVGQNILEGLAHRREAYRVAGLNTLPDAVSNFLCDRVHRVPALAETAAFAARFDEIVAAEQPDLIIPGRDDDVVFLAEWRAARAAAGRTSPALLAGAPELAATLRDKLLSYRFARARGLPFVETLSGDAGAPALLALAAGHGWPLIAKPCRGDGSRGVVLVLDEPQLRVAMSWPGYCFQPYLGTPQGLAALRQRMAGGVPLFWCLPGLEKLSVDGWVTPAGVVQGIICTRHTEVVFGRSERLELAVDGDLAPLARRFAECLAQAGWRGPFNLQLGRDAGGRIQCFEINGRFTGSSATLRHLGCDQVCGAIDAFLGRPAAAAPAPAPVARVDKRLGNWPMPDEPIEQLAQAGVWPTRTP